MLWHFQFSTFNFQFSIVNDWLVGHEAVSYTHLDVYKRQPATSCILQDRLGLPTSCFTLDISLGCCGYLHGLTVLSSLLSVSKGKALLLVGDTLYRTSSPYDKSRLPLFGDAGTATALEYNEAAEDIKSCLLYTSRCV